MRNDVKTFMAKSPYNGKTYRAEVTADYSLKKVVVKAVFEDVPARVIVQPCRSLEDVQAYYGMATKERLKYAI